MTNSEGERLERLERLLATFAPQAESFFQQLDSRIRRIQHQIDANSMHIEKITESLYLIAGNEETAPPTINQSLQLLNASLERIEVFLDLLMAQEDRK